MRNTFSSEWAGQEHRLLSNWGDQGGDIHQQTEKLRQEQLGAFAHNVIGEMTSVRFGNPESVLHSPQYGPAPGQYFADCTQNTLSESERRLQGFQSQLTAISRAGIPLNYVNRKEEIAMRRLGLNARGWQNSIRRGRASEGAKINLARAKKTLADYQAKLELLDVARYGLTSQGNFVEGKRRQESIYPTRNPPPHQAGRPIEPRVEGNNVLGPGAMAQASAAPAFRVEEWAKSAEPASAKAVEALDPKLQEPVANLLDSVREGEKSSVLSLAQKLNNPAIGPLLLKVKAGQDGKLPDRIEKKPGDTDEEKRIADVYNTLTPEQRDAYGKFRDLTMRLVQRQREHRVLPSDPGIKALVTELLDARERGDKGTASMKEGMLQMQGIDVGTSDFEIGDIRMVSDTSRAINSLMGIVKLIMGFSQLMKDLFKDKSEKEDSVTKDNPKEMTSEERKKAIEKSQKRMEELTKKEGELEEKMKDLNIKRSEAEKDTKITEDDKKKAIEKIDEELRQGEKELAEIKAEQKTLKERIKELEKVEKKVTFESTEHLTEKESQTLVKKLEELRIAIEAMPEKPEETKKVLDLLTEYIRLKVGYMLKDPSPSDALIEEYTASGAMEDVGKAEDKKAALAAVDARLRILKKEPVEKKAEETETEK